VLRESLLLVRLEKDDLPKADVKQNPLLCSLMNLVALSPFFVVSFLKLHVCSYISMTNTWIVTFEICVSIFPVVAILEIIG
jgi:hypothetical protein